jgi:hypothetical protein
MKAVRIPAFEATNSGGEKRSHDLGGSVPHFFGADNLFSFLKRANAKSLFLWSERFLFENKKKNLDIVEVKILLAGQSVAYPN